METSTVDIGRVIVSEAVVVLHVEIIGGVDIMLKAVDGPAPLSEFPAASEEVPAKTVMSTVPFPEQPEIETTGEVEPGFEIFETLQPLVSVPPSEKSPDKRWRRSYFISQRVGTVSDEPALAIDGAPIKTVGFMLSTLNVAEGPALEAVLPACLMQSPQQ